MKKIKIGQIGIGHNHGEGKMLAAQKFPELFEVIGYAEENEKWVEKRGNLPCYKDLPRLSVEEIIEKSDAILVECDVWNLTKVAKMCVEAGKHVHIDKPASGTLAEFEELLNIAKEKNLTVQMGYMYRYNFAIQKLMDMINSGELGEIYQIDAEMSTYHSKEYREWLKHFKGGSMYIFGSHLIDLVVSILGEPEKVYPFIKQTGFEGVYSDDNNFAVLEYDKAIARITNLSVEVNGWGMRRFAVMGSKGTVEIKPIELNVEMTKSTTDIASNAYQDMKEKVDIKDVPTLSRYDEMMKDFYKSVIGEKENPYSYEHELAVQKTLCKVVGEN
ncbi:MAG: Gfo/Idh/MocA family oxidoreductase [Clostridia bacterium]|nr:Gfo/Idh/MocA family oxidoreductase [Clostridia bacterium]